MAVDQLHMKIQSPKSYILISYVAIVRL